MYPFGNWIVHFFVLAAEFFIITITAISIVTIITSIIAKASYMF